MLWNRTVYITIGPKTTNHKCKQTHNAFHTPLIHRCLHSQTTESINVGGKWRDCDWCNTFDARICFAAMVTTSRRRQKQEQPLETRTRRSGRSGWHYYYYKKKRDESAIIMKLTHVVPAVPSCEMYVSALRIPSVRLSAPALLVCFPLAGICHCSGETQQACCWGHAHPRWWCITFQSQPWHTDRPEQVWNNRVQ